jgi:hypothetical protein
MPVEWECINSQPGLWTVGFRRPDGSWEPESDHQSWSEADDRARELNGETEYLRYVYQRSQPALWTVGFYDGDGWTPESGHDSELAAVARVIELNA